MNHLLNKEHSSPMNHRLKNLRNSIYEPLSKESASSTSEPLIKVAIMNHALTNEPAQFASLALGAQSLRSWRDLQQSCKHSI
jgi:hypothetical protein